MSEPLHPEVAVLNAALELPAGERSAYLDRACAGAPALRAQVAALLQAHESAGGFMETPPPNLGPGGDEVFNRPLTGELPDRIARYKLLRALGEGGCGVVYLAEQDRPVRRQVALKVIKLGMDAR